MTDDDPYDIELTRVFDVLPERLYRAFTDPDQFFPAGMARSGSRRAATPLNSTRASAAGSAS
jgi:hypothetical protein